MQAPQTINPTPPLPPRYGLLIAARDATADVPSFDWTAGAKWAPEIVALANQSGASANECGSAVFNAGDQSGAVTRYPVVLWTSARCSTLGYRTADYAGRAARKLAVEASYLAARELWAGAVTDAETLGNRSLNDTGSDTLTSSAVSVADGFALVEGGIAHYGHGRRGMIHCTPQVLYLAVDSGAVQRAPGGLWETPMGTIVVADAGYDGSAPGGGAATTTQWIYGTEVIDYLLSPVFTIPTSDPDAGMEAWVRDALDRTTNTVTAYASRLILVRWDENIHVAAEVTPDVPAIGP